MSIALHIFYSPEDIEKMKQQYHGNSYTNASSSSSSSGVRDHLEVELDNFLRILQSDPVQARNFIKRQPGMSGLPDEMLDQQLDMLRKMDPTMLKRALMYLKPLNGYYQKIDAFTGGRGKYVLIVLAIIMLVLVLFLVYLAWRAFWVCWGFIFGTTPKSSIDGIDTSEAMDHTEELLPSDSPPKAFSLGGHYDDSDEFEF